MAALLLTWATLVFLDVRLNYQEKQRIRCGIKLQLQLLIILIIILLVVLLLILSWDISAAFIWLNSLMCLLQVQQPVKIFTTIPHWMGTSLVCKHIK